MEFLSNLPLIGASLALIVSIGALIHTFKDDKPSKEKDEHEDESV